MDAPPHPAPENGDAPPSAARGRTGALGGLRLRARGAWIAASYALFATLWIHFSDRALAALAGDPQTLIRWSAYKGFGFVAITSVLLLLLVWSTYGAIESGYAALKTKERELRASEAQLDAIIRSATDAIITVDASRRVVLFNTSAESMFGLGASAALGQPLDRFVTGNHEPSPLGTRHLLGRHSAGHTFPVEAASSRVTGQERGPLLTLILRDITDRLAHEAEVERLKQLYAALSQINQAIVWTHSRDALLQQICRVLVEHGGFSMAWISWHDASTNRLSAAAEFGDHDGYLQNIRIYTDERPEGLGPSGTAFRENRPYICNDMLHDPATLPWRAEIERRSFRASAVIPIRLGDRPCGTLNVYADTAGFFQNKEVALLEEAADDISFALDNLEREAARQRAETIAQNETRFSSAIIESLPGILYFFDTDGHFLRWNKNFQTLTGYSAEEIARMHPIDFFARSDQPAIRERIARVFEHGEADIEAPLRAKDGTTTPYFFTGRRIQFQGRTCLVGVGLDVSERTRAVAALRELNETLENRVAERTAEVQIALVRAEAADRLKSAFLATMSHELRTPLNSIIGFTGILLQHLAGPLNPEQSKQLGMVRASARHLLELINDVLDLSKIEAGQLPLRRESFDLPATLRHAADAVLPLATVKNLSVTTHLATAPATMVGDRRRVEQILLNLLNNAIKFTDRGGVTLDAEPANTADGSPAVRISVTDTGVGIKAAELPSLFRPFHQLDSGLSRQHEGTGLGLAICRRLTDLMGGAITVRSTWAEGSEFTVLLPLDPAPLSTASPTKTAS